MLKQVVVTSTGGQVIWSRDLNTSDINTLLSDVILQGRQGLETTSIGPLTFHWRFDNIHQLIFIAVHETVIPCHYAGDLLNAMKQEFQPDFDQHYDILLRTFESSRPAQKPRAFKDTLKYAQAQGKEVKKKKKVVQEKPTLDYSDSTQTNSQVVVERVQDYDVAEMDDDEPEPTFSIPFLQGKTMTEKDLEPIIFQLKENLVKKNVALNVADSISESIKKGLVGSSVPRLSSMTSLVLQQTEKTIQQLLTPTTSTDILTEIQSCKDIYSIVFVGVNGVGKSTNLSKVCFWLLQKKLKVLIAACDTFRSGAVEQLKVHVKNLSSLSDSTLELFDRGYGKDPAGIAKEAIAYGKTRGFDVILIDTAGRMQDNEPLMRSLAKLVALNRPNKILFVGEALVGNEAVDQVCKFNQALIDFSGQSNPRTIDGMILTKFDTVDDKVGACISMTFITKRPIIFVGTGQTYTDLKRLNIKKVTKMLLK